jgi:hypothetical protein
MNARAARLGALASRRLSLSPKGEHWEHRSPAMVECPGDRRLPGGPVAESNAYVASRSPAAVTASSFSAPGARFCLNSLTSVRPTLSTTTCNKR